VNGTRSYSEDASAICRSDRFQKNGCRQSNSWKDGSEERFCLDTSLAAASTQPSCSQGEQLSRLAREIVSDVVKRAA
jgi:hypothetical protein